MPDPDNPIPPTTPFASREPTLRSSKDESHSPLVYPIYELGVESSRELDRIAIHEYAIPSIVLMENAARALCAHCIEMLGSGHSTTVDIYCGPGNNGGDGLALARHLHNHQIEPRILYLEDPENYLGDAQTNLRIIRRMGLEMIILSELGNDASDHTPPGLIVDALFGTGLTRAPEGTAAASILAINTSRERGARVLSVDVPSGLDAQTGIAHTPCVLADRTVSLAAMKSGYAALHAQSFLGRVFVEDIGAPRAILEKLGTRLHHDPQRPRP